MAKATKTVKPEVVEAPFIVPSIRNNDEKHIFEEMFDLGELPEMKAVGYVKIGNGTANWVSFTATIKGKDVLRLDVEEPNIRAIAEESAKIAFVSALIDEPEA